MTHKDLCDLRSKFVAGEIGGPILKKEFQEALEPRIGQLMALAEVGLKLRDAYRLHDENVSVRTKLLPVVLVALQRLEELEEAARRVS